MKQLTLNKSKHRLHRSIFSCLDTWSYTYIYNIVSNLTSSCEILILNSHRSIMGKLPHEHFSVFSCNNQTIITQHPQQNESTKLFSHLCGTVLCAKAKMSDLQRPFYIFCKITDSQLRAILHDSPGQVSLEKLFQLFGKGWTYHLCALTCAPSR